MSATGSFCGTKSGGEEMFGESIGIAIDALRANKLRSVLTMLGIIIGVGAVIAMVSIGMGVRDKVQNSLYCQ